MKARPHAIPSCALAALWARVAEPERTSQFRGELLRAWVYKINARYKGRHTGWHCDRYFRYQGRLPYDMGGREWIRSPLSWAHLRRVRRGDLFVCYQADERKIYGLARAASGGYESLPGSGIFDSVDFTPRGLRLKHPVNVQHPSARETFGHIRAFTVPSRGTIHALAADELRALLRQLVAFNRKDERQIRAFAQPRGRLHKQGYT